MGPTVDSRIKTLDVGVPLPHTQFEVKAPEHNLSIEYS